MSILNAFLEPERALIGVDTQFAAQHGSPRQISKLMPLIHLNAIVACRGSVFIATALFAMCQVVGSDFDELLEAMPGFLEHVSDKAAEIPGRIGVTDKMPFDGQSVIAVGWSAGRMIGRQFEQENRETGFVAEGFNPHYSAPWDESLPQFPDLKTREGMGVLARAQARLLREKCPDVAAGGRFIVAEITRNSMSIAPVCELG